MIALGCGAGLAAGPLTDRLTAPGDEASTVGASRMDGRRELTSGPADGRGDLASDPASRGGTRGRCTLDGPLEVGPETPRAFTCPSVRGSGDQSVTTRFLLGSPGGTGSGAAVSGSPVSGAPASGAPVAGSCAAVWVHVVSGDGYRVTVCHDRAALDDERDGRLRTLAFQELRPAAGPVVWRELEVRSHGSAITVMLDGEQVLGGSRESGAGTSGSVVLGLVPGTTQAATVTFADVLVTPI